jgi:hypothetical protein
LSLAAVAAATVAVESMSAGVAVDSMEAADAEAVSLGAAAAAAMVAAAAVVAGFAGHGHYPLFWSAGRNVTSSPPARAAPSPGTETRLETTTSRPNNDPPPPTVMRDGHVHGFLRARPKLGITHPPRTAERRSGSPRFRCSAGRHSVAELDENWFAVGGCDGGGATRRVVNASLFQYGESSRNLHSRY